MEIVIVGAGKVGESICTDLIREGHQLTLIDQDRDIVAAMSEKLDLKALVGNGTVPDIQMEADVPDCDVFISATPNDEINIVASIVASRLGAKHCVARIRNPEYSQGIDFGWDLIGISLMMNSDLEAAREIVEEFDFPAANYIEPFTIEGVKILNVRIHAGSELEGVPIYRLRSLIPDILLCTIEQEGEHLIPRASHILQAEDSVHVIGQKPALDHFLRMAGQEVKPFRSVFIIGGGITVRYLIPQLLARSLRVKLVERDRQKAEELALEFPNAEIVVGDGTEQEFLVDQRLQNADVSIALTNIDENNLMFSLFAHRLGVQKTITKVSRVNLVDLLDRSSLDTIITPRIAVANGIIRYVRSLVYTKDSDIEDYHRLDDGLTEAIVFRVKAQSRVIDIPLQELKLKDKVLIGLILHNGKVIIPAGRDTIAVGDRVIIIHMQEDIRTLDDILEDGA